MKKLFFLFLIVSISILETHAQTLTGKVTDTDSALTPLFQATVLQMKNGKTVSTYKTYFDGTYQIKVSKGQTYQLKFSYPGKADTSVSITVDKKGMLSNGTLFISLQKDGLRLSGFVMDQAQDIPIQDAYIILRNVMTRKEIKYITGSDGAYNLRMDYETNYTVRIDKLSPGILNRYSDTSFIISTIGFNKPAEYRMDIKLRPASGYTIPRPEYDPTADPDNKNIKPVIMVVGRKDSLQKRNPESQIIRNKDVKEPMMPNDGQKHIKVDIKTNQANDSISKSKIVEDSTAIKAEVQKKEVIAKRMHVLDSVMTIANQRTHVKPDIRKPDRSAHHRDSIRAQKALLAEKIKSIQADRQQAEQDSQLIVAEAKNKEILAARKHIRDSVALLERQTLQAKKEKQKEKEKESKEPEKQTHEKETEDKKQAELPQKEKSANTEPEVKKVKNTRDQSVTYQTGHHVAGKKPQPEKDPAAIKKTAPAPEPKVINDQAKKDTILTPAKKENKPIANPPAEQPKKVQQPEIQTKKEQPKEVQAKEITEDQLRTAASKVKVKNKERDNFDANTKMSIIQFEKNSSKIVPSAWHDMESLVKKMKDAPELKVELYGLASLDEDHPNKLSEARVRILAGLISESGIETARIHINNIGTYRSRSGCAKGQECTEDQHKLDRVVMYTVVK